MTREGSSQEYTTPLWKPRLRVQGLRVRHTQSRQRSNVAVNITAPRFKSGVPRPLAARSSGFGSSSEKGGSLPAWAPWAEARAEARVAAAVAGRRSRDRPTGHAHALFPFPLYHSHLTEIMVSFDFWVWSARRASPRLRSARAESVRRFAAQSKNEGREEVPLIQRRPPTETRRAQVAIGRSVRPVTILITRGPPKPGYVKFELAKQPYTSSPLRSGDFGYTW